jgi:hypothetical protein
MQRLAQSMGIAVAAYILEASSALHGRATIEVSDFVPTFIGIALISLVPPMLHRRLPPDAGVAVSGHAVR